MKGSINIVLEALRQDAFFITTYVADHADYLSAVLYQLGCNQVEILGKFLYEDGLIPEGKPIVFAAINANSRGDAGRDYSLPHRA